MALLRCLIWLQLLVFLLGLPVALASVLGDAQWAMVIIPWGLYCAFLFGRLQGSGRIKYGENTSFPTIAWIQAPDSLHMSLLRFNAAVGIVIAVAIYWRTS